MSSLGRYIVDAVVLEHRSPTELAHDHGISRRGFRIPAGGRTFWIGDRQIKRTQYRDLFASVLSDTSSNWVSLVAPAGFEPAISALRGLRPGPLDDGASGRS